MGRWLRGRKQTFCLGLASPQGQDRAFFFQHPVVPSVLSSVAPGPSGKAHWVTCVDEYFTSANPGLPT